MVPENLLTYCQLHAVSHVLSWLQHLSGLPSSSVFLMVCFYAFSVCIFYSAFIFLSHAFMLPWNESLVGQEVTATANTLFFWGQCSLKGLCQESLLLTLKATSILLFILPSVSFKFLNIQFKSSYFKTIIVITDTFLKDVKTTRDLYSLGTTAHSGELLDPLFRWLKVLTP